MQNLPLLTISCKMAVNIHIFGQLYKYMHLAVELLRIFDVSEKIYNMPMDFEKLSAGKSGNSILICGSPCLLSAIFLRFLIRQRNIPIVSAATFLCPVRLMGFILPLLYAPVIQIEAYACFLSQTAGPGRSRQRRT
jgi:hypothetical protein